ncbi:MAG: ACP S-malonyltransferase, partial [Bacteroidota bacterium]
PAGSLANLVKYNINTGSASKGFQTMSPFRQELRKIEDIKKHHVPSVKEVVPQSTATEIPAASGRPLRAYAFPGQGSQKKGMGEGLFDEFPDLTRKAGEILGYSIKDLCINNTDRNLNKTEYTQPALFVVNALTYLKSLKDGKSTPDVVVGHSLGEYSALFAAGVFDFETGLRLVQKRGELMSKMKAGGMAAVKGLSKETLLQVISSNGLDEIDVANYNSFNQIVLSGPKDLIVKSGKPFEEAGASLYFPLNVSGAFHSRYMKPAKEEFEVFLNSFNFSAPKIPVISNVEASYYTQEKVKTLLADQLLKSVKWTDSITFIMEKGEVTFEEMGPGEVLTKLIYSIRKNLQEAAVA